MKIVTASWRVTLPPTHAAIGISRGTPRGRGGFRKYVALNPGRWFMSCSTPEEFSKRYFDEVLAQLDARRVVSDLLALADGRVPALLCWEPPPPDPAPCHRALVSAWLADQLGMEVPELGHEHLGWGWDHPKLDPALCFGSGSE